MRLDRDIQVKKEGRGSIRMKVALIVFACAVSVGFAALLNCGLAQWSQTNDRSPRWNLIAESKFVHAERFSDLFFFDKNNGIAIGGLIIKKTSDGGKNWEEIQLEGINSFYSLIFNDKQPGWVVGSTHNSVPLLMKTNNRGVEWQMLDFDKANLNGNSREISLFSDICFGPEGKSWIASNIGVLEVFFNEKNVKLINMFSTERTLNSIFCTESGDVWAVGENGTVLHYENGWTRKEMDKKYVFNKVQAFGDDLWILGGDWTENDQVKAGFPRPGVLFRSQDQGKTWENKTPKSANLLYDLYFDEDSGWLVGAGGNIYHSSDHGNSWMKQESPTNNDLLQIFFLDRKNGWISGNHGTILRYGN